MTAPREASSPRASLISGPGAAAEWKLAELAGGRLGVSPAEVSLERQRDSFTNFVYRATAGGRSIVLKHSDNVASLSGRRLPEAHIRVEYEFLRAAGEIGEPGIRLPTALTYDAQSNTVVMSDLGLDGLPLHRLTPGRAPDASVLHALGRFLREVHTKRWPPALISLLERERNNYGWCTFKFEGWSTQQPGWMSDRPFAKPVRPGLTVVDFTPQNCLVFGGNVGVFDFDFVSLADQLIDLANFQSRILFLAALGQIPRERIDLVDGILDGYFDGDLTRLERDGASWEAFCAYLAALLYYRCARDYDAQTAVSKTPLCRQVYSGNYQTWPELRDSFLDGMRTRD